MVGKVAVKIRGTNRVIEARRGENLGRILATNGLLPLPCGGNGLCGLCRVRVWGSVGRPTIYEKTRGLSGETRLACQTHVLGDVEVELPRVIHPRAPRFSLLVEPRRRNPLIKLVPPNIFPGAMMRVVVKEPRPRSPAINPREYDHVYWGRPRERAPSRPGNHEDSIPACIH